MRLIRNSLLGLAVLFLVLCLSSKKAYALKDLGDAGRGLYLEPSLGFLIPLGDDHYTDLVDISFKLGLPGKLGYLFKVGPILLGPEFASDFTPYNDDSDVPGHLHLFRLRFLA